MIKKISIGVDIGGSHITCAAVDLGQKRILDETMISMHVDNQASSEEILTLWAQALKQTMDGMQGEALAGIGFAMPGPFDYKKGIALFERVKKFESLYGVDVSAALRMKLGLSKDFPLRYINDATAFAIGEAWAGEGSDFKRVMAFTLGTGFGSAFLKDGIPIIQGADVPTDGCIWYVPFQSGIADDYISTRWFLQQYKDRTGKEVGGVWEIAEKLDEESVVFHLFEEFGSNMGQIVVPHAQKFQAEAIVLGGNISNAYYLFGNAFEEKLDSAGIEIPVFVTELGEDAAILGSARLLEDNFYQKLD